MAPTDDTDVDLLIEQGSYARAAQLLRRRGELVRAQALYERVWDFASAAEVAQERGDRPELLRLLIDARDFRRAAHLRNELEHVPPTEQERVAEIYEHKRMWAEAAAFWERIGRREHARDLYRKAQLPLEAARLDQALGHLREAGIACERLLVDEPHSPDAPRAALLLGRILSGFGRHQEAVRYVQQGLAGLSPLAVAPTDAHSGADRPGAGDTRELARELRRALVVDLAALGYRHAARYRLTELRQDEPHLPDLDDFLAAEHARRAAEDRPRSSSSEPDAGSEQLLGGRYAIIRLLGSGGMGRVYQARDRLLDRDVAVKVVAPPVDALAQKSFARFLREARIVSALRHPHIVAVHDFDEALGLLVMEYMVGGTIADRLAASLSPSRTRAVLLQVLAGLQAAHAQGIIHRDIKPANIFLTQSGDAKLGDFGVAHLQDLGATQTGGFIGTLAYMAPEQITGAPLTYACDVYALGITAFQMFSGQLPLSGPDFVGQHLGAVPPVLSSLRPDLVALDPILARMLAKDPAARYDSLEALAGALAAVAISAERAPLIATTRVEAPPTNASSGITREHERDRYRSDAHLGDTAVSTLERGMDQRLGRAVIIERFPLGYFEHVDGKAHLSWLRAMARHGDPHLQRVLRLDLETHRVIYEAPLGRTLTAPLALTAAAQIARDIARALAGAHAEGVGHGALTESSLVHEDTGVTVLVGGSGVRGAAPEDDARALIAMLLRLTPALPPDLLAPCRDLATLEAVLVTAQRGA